MKNIRNIGVERREKKKMIVDLHCIINN